MDCMTIQLKVRRLKWLGHVFRMENVRVPKLAMTWKPTTGSRKVGRPFLTHEHVRTGDLDSLGLSLGEARKLAQDRTKWRKLIAERSGAN